MPQQGCGARGGRDGQRVARPLLCLHAAQRGTGPARSTLLMATGPVSPCPESSDDSYVSAGEDPLEAPIFEIPIQDMAVAVGAEVLLKCIVTANPQPEGERLRGWGGRGCERGGGAPCVSTSHPLSRPLAPPELCGVGHTAPSRVSWGGGAPTPGAPLSPCLPPGRREELGHLLPGQGVEGRVWAGGLLLPRPRLGRWESGRRATEHWAGRDGRGSGLLLLGQRPGCSGLMGSRRGQGQLGSQSQYQLAEPGRSEAALIPSSSLHWRAGGCRESRQELWEPRGCSPWQRGLQARQGSAWPRWDPAQTPGGAWALLPTSDPRLCWQCPGGRTGSRCGAARRGPSRRRASAIPCWSGVPG